MFIDYNVFDIKNDANCIVNVMLYSNIKQKYHKYLI